MEPNNEIVLKETKEVVKVILTTTEVRELGQDLARKYSEIIDLEDQKKAVTSEYKSRIDAGAAEASALARKIGNGYEFREVHCQIYVDVALSRTYTVRMDTGEILKSRPATSDELQTSLIDREEVAERLSTEMTEGENGNDVRTYDPDQVSPAKPDEEPTDVEFGDQLPEDEMF